MQKVFRYLEMFSRDGLRDRRTDILITNAAIHYIVRPKKNYEWLVQRLKVAVNRGFGLRKDI